ncbi:MAG: VOC family protein [Acidobacteria bacterium]|nr:VOC family protein [Acidobacteriota bacterium]
MSEEQKPGSIGWTDLTVPNADALRDFYSAVAGWQAEALDMGGYSDYVMKAPDGTPVAGICHARGSNANLPPRWLVYIVVEDLDSSLAQCQQLGGKIIAGPKGESPNPRYAIIEDPSGAPSALYQPAAKPTQASGAS